jgi:hypothetical protein
MKKKILLPFGAVVIVLAGIATFAKHSELARFFELNSVVRAESLASSPIANQQAQSSEENNGKNGVVIKETDTASSCSPINDVTAFDMFFIKVVSLERAVAKAKSRGEDGNLWSNYLRREGFSDSEINTIREIANQHAAEVAPLHSQAVQIIRSGRETLTKTGHLPPPPPELASLQERRGAIASRNKNRLETLLGAETVRKARELMKSKSTTTPVDTSDLLNSEERMRQFRQRTEGLSNRKEVTDND